MVAVRMVAVRKDNRVGGEGLTSPSSHTTGRTVPYHGGSQRPCCPQRSQPVHFLR